MNAPDSELGDHLTTEQTARFLGLSPSTLAKMRLYGSGPTYMKLGRRVMYRLDDLERWMDANPYSSTSQYSSQVR